MPSRDHVIGGIGSLCYSRSMKSPMHKKLITGMMLSLSMVIAQPSGAQPESTQEATLKSESIEDYTARMQWFVEANYGMFIHFEIGRASCRERV